MNSNENPTITLPTDRDHTARLKAIGTCFNNHFPAVARVDFNMRVAVHEERDAIIAAWEANGNDEAFTHETRWGAVNVVPTAMGPEQHTGLGKGWGK